MIKRISFSFLFLIFSTMASAYNIDGISPVGQPVLNSIGFMSVTYTSTGATTLYFSVGYGNLAVTTCGESSSIVQGFCPACPGAVSQWANGCNCGNSLFMTVGTFLGATPITIGPFNYPPISYSWIYIFGSDTSAPCTASSGNLRAVFCEAPVNNWISGQTWPVGDTQEPLTFLIEFWNRFEELIGIEQGSERT